MEWSGPAIRPGLDNRHLIIEGHRGPLDFGFGTWIWDLDLGLDLGLTILEASIHASFKPISPKLLRS